MSQPDSTQPIELSVQQTKELLASDESFLLLDCREPFEYEIASITQAKLIPMGDLGERLEEIKPHQDQRVVVFCHHGRRSLLVAQALRNAGFANAQSMAGGIDAWSLEIDPGVPRY